MFTSDGVSFGVGEEFTVGPNLFDPKSRGALRVYSGQMKSEPTHISIYFKSQTS